MLGVAQHFNCIDECGIWGLGSFDFVIELQVKPSSLFQMLKREGFGFDLNEYLRQQMGLLKEVLC